MAEHIFRPKGPPPRWEPPRWAIFLSWLIFLALFGFFLFDAIARHGARP